MDNQNLETALCDLVESIKGIALGSIQSVVIDAAAIALICSWNCHNEEEEQIDIQAELNNWNKCKLPNEVYSISKPFGCGCPCGEDH